MHGARSPSWPVAAPTSRARPTRSRQPARLCWSRIPARRPAAPARSRAPPAPRLPAAALRRCSAARLGRPPRAPDDASQPGYVYDLVGWWPERVPAGACSTARIAARRRFVEQYDSLGGTSADGHRVREMPLGLLPGGGVVAWGLVRPVAVPSTVTHFVSPMAEWDRSVEIEDAAGPPKGRCGHRACPSTRARRCRTAGSAVRSRRMCHRCSPPAATGSRMPTARATSSGC